MNKNSTDTKTEYPIALPSKAQLPPLLEGIIKLSPIAVVLILAPLGSESELGRRLLLTVVIFLTLYLTRKSNLGVILAVLFLAFVGGLRRNLIPIIGWSNFDPLLLICPVVLTINFVGKVLSKQVQTDTPVSRLMIWLLALMCIEIFNPLQGGLEVGLAGALYYIVPIFWFYLGKDKGTPELVQRLFLVVVGFALISMVYGYCQSFIGFTASERIWLQNYSYGSAIQDGTTPRAIGFSTNGYEYAQIMGYGAIILWATFLRGNVVALIPIPGLIIGIFLEGVRTNFVLTLFACLLLLAIQDKNVKNWLPRILLVLAVGLAGFVWSLQKVQQGNYDSYSKTMIAHQTGGLLNPFDKKKSTVSIHSGLINQGFINGFTTPWGRGLGATTPAASKFGGDIAGTEMDISNMFVSLGFIGGILYLLVVGRSLILAFRLWHYQRKLISLAIVGMLISMVGGWSGGQYLISMITWFCVGVLDRTSSERITGR